MSENNVVLIDNINVEFAHSLIGIGAIPDVNHRLNGQNLPIDSPTLLHIAIYKSDEELFDYCMNKGADINISFETYGSPLHLAVYKLNGNVNILHKLIQAGANLNAREYSRKWSPLHVACYYGKYKAAKMLIDNGADVNITTQYQIEHPLPIGITPLHIAIERNHNDIVELLCEKNADLRIHPFNVGTPLFFAAISGRCNIVSTLLNFGADINLLSTIYRRTDRLSESAVRVPDRYFLTPLHAAILKQIYEMVRVLLLNQKISVNLNVYEFQTPLHCAVESRSDTIVLSLLNSGGDINVLSANKKSLIEHCLEKNPHDDGIKLRIIEVLRHHIIKLEHIRWQVSKKNGQEVRDKKYQIYRQRCVQEVNMMLKDRIGVGNISVYDLLDYSKNYTDLLRGFTGDRIFCEEFKFRYPLYSGLVQYRLLRYLQSQGNFPN